nr:ANTAR domain-containing protein [Frigoribacterium sp. CG_9.8]
MRRETHQATGMIFTQLGVSMAEAFALLQARAFAEGRPIAEVALNVVQRKLDFRDPGEYPHPEVSNP